MNSDINGGDLNKMNMSLTENGVYQTFITGKLLKRINQPIGSSDYYILILIYEKEMEIKKPHQLQPDIMNYNDY